MTTAQRIKTYLQQIGPWPPHTVCIMGLGPGDPGLLSVKALLRLADAQVVVYDMGRQPPQIQPLVAADALHICVGRTDHRPRIKSTELAHLIKPHHAQGKRIAILKSGHPMVFNRGEQDALALAAAGMAFEIVPAPTAALAAAAYAGIPVTDRKKIDAVSLAIGKSDPDPHMIVPDLAALTRSGTLAVYMAEDNIVGLAERLRSGALDPSTPLAIVENATRPDQRVIRTTLEHLVATARQADLQKPAIIFLGPAADASPDLRWFERRPLTGQRILVTRPIHQAAPFIGQLSAHGAEVICAPTLEIQSLDALEPEHDALLKAASHAKTYDYLVFTSANAIEAFLLYLPTDIRDLAGPRIAVIGTSTLERFREMEITPDVVPGTFTSESLARSMEQMGLKEKRCLLLRSDLADQRLPEMLRSFGAQVDDLIAYRAVCPPSLPPQALTALQAGRVDWATFTSASTFKNFLTLLGPQANQILPHLKLASLGPLTTAAIHQAGHKVEVQAQDHTTTALANVITKHKRASTPL